ncbi:MAG: three-Cys-motif partner protein TcmP [Sedimentisphaerales bacterium]|nr:three-Cys-motif partner protein TcmP [Sedimentisphaerales bacterium]
MDNICDFFREKKGWSKYKDLILDYYLKPYLQKIKVRRRPILVVDCFAGPGKFDDGQVGSPLIIADHLRPLCQEGYEVTAFFIEANKPLYDQLIENVCGLGIPVETRLGSFRDYVGEIEKLSLTHSVFVYLDPFKPMDLFFDDLAPIYNKVRSGQSIETLINFMSASFLRAVQSFRTQVILNGTLQTSHELIRRWNGIAGGTYWQQIVYNEVLSSDEEPDTKNVDNLACGYAAELQRWFKYVLNYPIRAKYEHKWPKYHLIFGSRYPDGVELMNLAMVKARRKFVKKGFIEGCLFPNQPEQEVVDPDEVLRVVLETASELGKTTWADLRVHATIAIPATYKESEWNNAIKQAIRAGKVGSECCARKIENKAFVWPIS